jgi:hypothetical protein
MEPCQGLSLQPGGHERRFVFDPRLSQHGKRGGKFTLRKAGQMDTPYPSSILEVVSGLKRTSHRESHGPCWRCGGTDRFVVFHATGRGWCRQCGWTGDAIQLLRDRDGLTFRAACEALGRLGLLPSRTEEPGSASCVGGPPTPRDVSPPSPNAAIPGDVPTETNAHLGAKSTNDAQASACPSSAPTGHEQAASLANLDRAPASPAPARATPRMAVHQHVAPPALDTLPTANAGTGADNPTSDNQQSILPATSNLPASAPDSSRAPAPVYPRIPAKVHCCERCRGWFLPKRFGERFCCNACGQQALGVVTVRDHSLDCPITHRA